MNWNAICTVYLKELKDSLRDKRTLITTIVIPTLLIPLMMFGAGFVMKKIITKAQSETTTVMIVGGVDSPKLVAAIKANEDFRIVETTEDFKDKISNKKVRVAVDIPNGFDADLAKGEMPKITLFHYQGEMKSSMGRGQLNGFLNDYRAEVVEASFKTRGLPMSLAKPFEVKSQNVAPPEKVGGNAIGGFVPYIIVILCFTGAMYPAMDLTAGEKERGTMETLLCSPLNRVNIVMGKFLMTFTASIATMILSLTTLGLSAMVAGSVLGGEGAAAAAAGAGGGGGEPMVLIDPMGLVGVFAMILPVAVLFSAVLLTISLFAKSFKEAQSYVSPGMIIVIMPAVIGMLPGIDLNMKTAFIPITNLSLVCKEMLSGVWNWDYIALIFTSSGVYAAIALWLCVKMFNREDVIFRA
jgi:sodium transport system permease protein